MRGVRCSTLILKRKKFKYIKSNIHGVSREMDARCEVFYIDMKDMNDMNAHECA